MKQMHFHSVLHSYLIYFSMLMSISYSSHLLMSIILTEQTAECDVLKYTNLHHLLFKTV